MRARTAFIVGVAAAVIALAVTGLVWAKSYAPLRVAAYGPGYGIAAKPRASQGLIELVIDGHRNRVGEARLVVRNSGRWPVTIERYVNPFGGACGPEPEATNGGCAQLSALREAPTETAGSYAKTTAASGAVRVAAHGTTSLWMRFAGLCYGKRPSGSEESTLAITLRYSYLGVFHRTQDVQWPFRVSYLC